MERRQIIKSGKQIFDFLKGYTSIKTDEEKKRKDRNE
jgi:hypothetical protein